MFVLLLSRAVGGGLRNAEACSIISLYPDFLAKAVTLLHSLDASRPEQRGVLLDSRCYNGDIGVKR